jgi:hypothetical protein
MCYVTAIINGSRIVNGKRFSSSKKASKYISSILNTYGCQITEEYESANGHELVADYNNRIFVQSANN